MKSLELKSIEEINTERFEIPSYQRGYRWRKEQVLDLLDDINEFKTNETTNDIYCLQPVVIKKCGEKYRVIDGQQRLTTIFLILKYLGKETYSISYYRKGSEEYLNDIKNRYLQEKPEDNNADYYFIKNAYNTIVEWFKDKKENHENHVIDTMGLKIQAYCKVIWYEIDNEDLSEEEIFTRLNMGKIPLTDSELIKALFLKKSNYQNPGDDVRLKQIEIGKEWDMIENFLQDESVWYYINPDYQTEPSTRIDYIFDVLSNNTDLRKNNRYTFRYFSELLKEKTIDEIWDRIKDYYRIIREWYEDRELYHLIGFLTTTDCIDFDELIKDYYDENYTKIEFKEHIKDLIKVNFENVNIDDLEYGSDNQIIQEVLLLFNVITVMNKASAYSRFPFDLYKKNRWSLEHIHAQNAENIKNRKELWISWIDEHINSFKTFEGKKYEKIVNELEAVDKDSLTRDEFLNLFDLIKNEIKDDYGDEINNISNLALLTTGDNSAISNSFFDVKRRIIVDKDKHSEFIPICTRNVFLKYYSDDATQIHYWADRDREDYLKWIKNDLSEYLSESENETNGQ